MKIKILSLILSLFLLLGAISVFTGCNNSSSNDDKLSIVVTTFPLYDWTKQIIGDATDAKITVLMDSGVDLHNYQPTVDDLVTIANADLFIYIGGHSDEWVDGLDANVDTSRIEMINIMQLLGDAVKEEEHVDGMEHVHDENCDHEHDEEDEHDEHASLHENDEHVWLSLKNANTSCIKITEALCKVDPDNADVYMTNSHNYRTMLTTLDAQYQEAVSHASKSVLLFGDRFPFRYLVDDYGIEYYAAFSGCSAESEASFETIAFLAGKIDELGLTSIIKIEGSDGSIAKTIANSSSSDNVKILTLNSMQTTTTADAQNGITYLSIMENNLLVLKEALQ